MRSESALGLQCRRRARTPSAAWVSMFSFCRMNLQTSGKDVISDSTKGYGRHLTGVSTTARCTPYKADMTMAQMSPNVLDYELLTNMKCEKRYVAQVMQKCTRCHSMVC